MNMISRVKACALMTAAVLLSSALTPAVAIASEESAADKEAIAELIYCYARGTDAIGDSTLADPVGKGINIYRQCIAENAEVRVWFPQLPFDSQTFPNPNAYPDTAPQPIVGVVNYANFVDAVDRGNGYKFTQHMMSNISVSTHGRTGRVTSYLNATLVIPGTVIGGPSKCVAVANGTYSAEVQKFGDAWKITKLNLTLISFNSIFHTGAGCQS
jgi:hypothetical protein